ncbi:amidase [Crenobacter cavernae]|uniref:Amidase n=1 Tax=Crenobacter cavernae TaxID=2290923 RepID=A0A345Y8X4_9NEIS|nr:amidase [Crenobacter cavernae]AXK40376.1 amidase [Crenobacter cavernae]
MKGFTDYEDYDGLGLAELIKKREVSAEEVLDAALARIDARNGTLNAVVHRMDDAARRQIASPLPDSPLAGVPTLIKDLLADVAGEPTRNGCRLFDGYRASADVELIRRYRAAGLVFAGKSATPELGLYPFTESEVYGATRNPWDPTRTPGGSSGGAGAAVAAGIVPFAHGGDGGGSIRIPASNCGLFGLKPSRGRSPIGPSLAEVWQGMVVEHAISRSVRDSAALLDAMGGAADGDAYRCPPPAIPFLEQIATPPAVLRIAVGYDAPLGGALHPDCRRAVEHTARLLEGLGHHVVEASPKLPSAETFNRAMLTIVAGELALRVRNSETSVGRAARHTDFEAGTWAMARYGERLSAGQFAWARDFLFDIGRRMAAFHRDYDVVLCPVLNRPPAKIGELGVTPLENAMSRVLIGVLGQDWTLSLSNLIESNSLKVLHYIGWTVHANMSGQPAMSVPLYWSDENLPIGSQLIGRYGEDGLLLQLAAQLEAAQPWARRRPLLQP